MCTELDIQYTDTTEVVVVKVVFSTFGFGHYYLEGTLQSWNWSHFRFHGTLPYEEKDELDQEMVCIGPDIFTVEHASGPSNAKGRPRNE